MAKKKGGIPPGQIERLIREVRTRRNAVTPFKSKLTLGYSAPYAVYVHEILTNRHEPPARAKFLEIAIRTSLARVNKIVGDTWKNKSKTLNNKNLLKKAHLKGAEYIISQSTIIVPVDTGLLMNSWFIRDDDSGTVYSRTNQPPT